MGQRKILFPPKFQIFSLTVVLFCTGLLSCAPNRPESFLLITIDTLRADHLSAYGYRLPTSPEMERLANRGTLFEYAFSTSACTAPSTASILTGRYPSYHTVGLLNGLHALDSATPTLATVLREHGFRTGAIVGNPVLRSGLGLNVGFETYDDRLEGRELNRPGHRERAADRVRIHMDPTCRTRGGRGMRMPPTRPRPSCPSAKISRGTERFRSIRCTSTKDEPPSTNDATTPRSRISIITSDG
jgi:hypothetical protein